MCPRWKNRALLRVLSFIKRSRFCEGSGREERFDSDSTFVFEFVYSCELESRIDHNEDSRKDSFLRLALTRLWRRYSLRHRGKGSLNHDCGGTNVERKTLEHFVPDPMKASTVTSSKANFVLGAMRLACRMYCSYKNIDRRRMSRTYQACEHRDHTLGET